MLDRTVLDAIGAIEKISRRDPGGRGLAAHADCGLLSPAAVELASGERVVIVTGFCIRSACIGETDGPPGALALADALSRSGKDVLLVSDDFSIPLLEAGAYASDWRGTIRCLSRLQNDADAEIDAIVASFAPTHVIAIERPGSAADGHRYSMRGEKLDDLIPAADRLLPERSMRSYRTLAVGDGGNELGMGSLRDRLKEKINLGDLIFCTTAADHVIPAGISNWGAYALAAALSLLDGRLLLRSPEDERAVLAAMVAAGAVDGCSGQRALSVDGLPWEAYGDVLEAIYRATCDGLAAGAAA